MYLVGVSVSYKNDNKIELLNCMIIHVRVYGENCFIEL